MHVCTYTHQIKMKGYGVNIKHIIRWGAFVRGAFVWGAFVLDPSLLTITL